MQKNQQQFQKDPILQDSYEPSGEMLPIFTYPDPILSKVARPVTVFDETLKKLCLDMLYTMYKAPGIGLAAPQIGKSIRLFVMDTDYDREKIMLPNGDEEMRLSNFNPIILINPIIKDKQGEILYEEGCLSVPGIFEEVKRANDIIVDYQNTNGEHLTLNATELLAVCVQHENDHLDGVVFIERLSLMKKNLLKKKAIKNKKRESSNDSL